MKTLAVTTCHRPTPLVQGRAQVLAARFRAPLLEPGPSTTAGVSHLYVVGRRREEVRGADSVCFVQEGMLAAKRHDGLNHPFLRALGPCETLVDCTLGLANDALHAALLLGCRVLGIEGSTVLHALLEEGLPRLARKHPGAENIALAYGQAADVLRTLEDDSHDVVYLDPMMGRPEKAAPVFDLVRELAVPEPASLALLAEARRVARSRVVLKLEKSAAVPGAVSMAFDHAETGGRVRYWIHRV